MTETPYTITIYDDTVDHGVLDEVVDLYREIYAEPPYFEGDKDFTSFADDLPRRATQRNFRLVVGRLGPDALGFAMGHRLPTSTTWWVGASTTIPAEITAERPARTFAVIEIAVRAPHRRLGYGLALHIHLTAGLTEERTTLLVRPDARAAQAAYRSWGYESVGVIRPNPGGPLYEAMVSTT